MYEGKSISVVIPAYNERKQIKKVITTIPEYVDKIIVIDDCSTDNTGEIVNELKENNDKIIYFYHEQNQGVGGSIATGYKWSRDNDIDVAVVMAGDGQMNPDDLPVILDPVVKGEVDYSKANRLIADDALKTIPKVRLIGNSILSLLTKIASGYWHIADSQTGYTAINKEALHEINWDKMYKRFGQPNDVLVRLNIHNFRVRDVKTHPVYHVGEESKLKVRKVIFTISYLLIKLFFMRMVKKYVVRNFHPLVFFYFSGFISILLSFFFFYRMVDRWILFGSIPELSAIAWTFFVTIGLQSTFFAMWFDMESNKHLR